MEIECLFYAIAWGYFAHSEYSRKACCATHTYVLPTYTVYIPDRGGEVEIIPPLGFSLWELPIGM